MGKRHFRGWGVAELTLGLDEGRADPQDPHLFLTLPADPQGEAANKGQEGQALPGATLLASLKGLPLLPREFQWANVPGGRVMASWGHSALCPPLPPRVSSFLVLLFTLTESGLKCRAGGTQA